MGAPDPKFHLMLCWEMDFCLFIENLNLGGYLGKYLLGVIRPEH
jgi:hypothetical protein